MSLDPGSADDYIQKLGHRRRTPAVSAGVGFWGLLLSNHFFYLKVMPIGLLGGSEVGVGESGAHWWRQKAEGGEGRGVGGSQE